MIKSMITLAALSLCAVLAFTPRGADNSPSRMVPIPGGTFEMGDTFGDGGASSIEVPVHTVTLDSFYLGNYCVTFEEFDAFCADTGRGKPDDQGWGRGKRPVSDVSWNDAVKYCNWLSGKEGLVPFYDIKGSGVTQVWLQETARGPESVVWVYVDGHEVKEDWSADGYRLPTEAEWEYAARERGKRIRFGNGKDRASPKEINFNGSRDCKKRYSETGKSRGRTMPVGTFPPNALGLHDMGGNVMQWCNDLFDEAYYSKSPRHNPKGGDEESGYSGSNGYNVRVVRGGFFGSDPYFVRASARQWLDPNWGFNIHFVRGFRLCRSVPR